MKERSQRTSSGWGLVPRKHTMKMQIIWNMLVSSGQWTQPTVIVFNTGFFFFFLNLSPHTTLYLTLLLWCLFFYLSSLSFSLVSLLPQVFKWEGLFLCVGEMLRLLSGRLGRRWHHVAWQRKRGKDNWCMDLFDFLQRNQISSFHFFIHYNWFSLFVYFSLRCTCGLVLRPARWRSNLASKPARWVRNCTLTFCFSISTSH